MSLKARIEALEAKIGVGRAHFIWAPAGVDVKAEIARRIEEGSAAADDRWFSFAWSSGPEKPMHPDPFRYERRPEGPPEAANDP